MAKKRLNIFFTVGIFAIMLPIILQLGDQIFGEKNHQYFSLSKYFHSPFVLVYAGVLTITSILFYRINSLSQKGNKISKLSGIFLFMSLVFPTSKKEIGNTIVVSPEWQISETLHITFGSLFFILVTLITYKYLSDAVFKKRLPLKLLPYKSFSVVMSFCMIIIATDYFFHELLPPNLQDIPIKLIFESIWCWSMGFSWIHFYFKIIPKNYNE